MENNGSAAQASRTHPWPYPTMPKSLWGAAEWQAAANHYWYEKMEVDTDDPNYRPVLSLLESAHRHAVRQAQAYRAANRLAITG